MRVTAAAQHALVVIQKGPATGPRPLPGQASLSRRRIRGQATRALHRHPTYETYIPTPRYHKKIGFWLSEFCSFLHRGDVKKNKITVGPLKAGTPHGLSSRRAAQGVAAARPVEAGLSALSLPAGPRGALAEKSPARSTQGEPTASGSGQTPLAKLPATPPPRHRAHSPCRFPALPRPRCASLPRVAPSALSSISPAQTIASSA
jgi:hypothetical protein